MYHFAVKSSLQQIVSIEICDFLLLMFTDYRYGICLTNTNSNKVLIMLTARNEHDRKNFIEDLKETILEVHRL